jgi:hypothetical protein
VKLTIIAFITAVLACWFAAYALAATSPKQTPVVIPPVEVAPSTPELKSDKTVIRVPDITIVGYVPAKHLTKKHFKCGAWRPLMQGSGNVQECEWK